MCSSAMYKKYKHYLIAIVVKSQLSNEPVTNDGECDNVLHIRLVHCWDRTREGEGRVAKLIAVFFAFRGVSYCFARNYILHILYIIMHILSFL